ncbi:MAG: hypothetical protein Q8907_08630 [Bacteroidota bacterium]|nr:hypothetical protein [Bacteroidota bacterium]MDP4225305.1 hypothetical protein [Bacteroidota bacterium]MDP4274328.1 hypothetical protein [Bacteroidota bacterium]
MIYKFRLISDESDDFFRDFEIRDTQTFYDFHSAIQQEMDYDPSQVASFFTTDSKWKRKKEITMFDPSEEGTRSKSLVMDKVKLSDFIKTRKDKLVYVFDMLSDRSFFIELIDGDAAENKGVAYPVCTDSNGNPPEQIVMEDKMAKKNDYAFSDFTNDEVDEEGEEEEDVPEDFDPNSDLGLDTDINLDDDFEDDGYSGNFDDYYDYR